MMIKETLKKTSLKRRKNSPHYKEQNKQNCPGRKHCICTGPLTWKIPQKSQSFVWISCYLSSEHKCSAHLCGSPIFPFHLAEFHIHFRFWGQKSTVWLMSQRLCQAGGKSSTLTPAANPPCIRQRNIWQIKFFTTQQ